jgi:hypothetical protein
MNGPQLVSLVSALAIMAMLFELLRRHRLREKYAVMWGVLSLAAIIGAVFPGLLTGAADLLGLQVPANLLFFLSIVVLLGRTLAEEVALLRMEVERQHDNS